MDAERRASAAPGSRLCDGGGSHSCHKHLCKEDLPTCAINTGEELWGLDGTSYRPLAERHRVTFPCHAPLAHHIHKGLIKKGFDVASGAVFKPMRRPEHGVSHGEIRAWITVAGALRRPATVVEYIRAHHAKVGLGFAYWPSPEASDTVWAAALEVAQARYADLGDTYGEGFGTCAILCWVPL